MRMRPFEDLQHILPEPLKTLVSRKAYVVFAIIIFSLCLACVVLIAVVASGAHRSHPTSVSSQLSPETAAISAANQFLCLTSTCLEIGAMMSKGVDPTVDPCDNFYQYACGGWMQRTSVPPGWPNIAVMDNLRHENDQKLVNVVFSHIRRDSTNSAERKMKEFYDVCSHDYGRMKDGGKALIDIIRNDLGGWYLLDPDNWKTNWNLNTAVTKAQSDFLVDVMFSTWVVSDRRNMDRFIINIREGGVGLYYNMYRPNDDQGVLSAYQDYIRSIALLLLRDANVTMDSTRRDQVVNQFVTDVFNQEYQLAQGMKMGRAAGNYWQTTVGTVDVLSRNFTQIDWLTILKGLYGNDVTSSTQVSVNHIAYFQYLDQVLRNESMDKDRIMNNYIVWRLVDYYAHELSWEYQVHGLKLTEVMYGYEAYMPSWEDCLYTVESRMGLALAHEYVAEHIGSEGRSQVKDIYSALIKSLQGIIQTSQWMDNVTVARALDKISHLEGIVGFPEELLQESYIDDYYSNLQINSSLSYLQNLMNTNIFVKQSWRRQLTQDRQEWFLEVLQKYYMFQARPWYYSSFNKMIVPSGSMHLPLFVVGEPRYLDYGALGFQISKQLIDSINTRGRYRWHNSTFWNWWTNTTRDQYSKSWSCFTDYISNITVGPYLVNGQNRTVTLPSWSAYSVVEDLAGLQMSFKAYKAGDHGDRHPPGLNITNDQAFFVAAAQSTCVKRSDDERYEWASAGYAIEEIRLNHALRQLPAFQDTYKCPKTKFMYFKDFCQLY